ncbi:mitotic-spindle organizing protein 1B [Trifolium repens]|nr:mitotic-spindle organizing protein 1B [Trifolium repens]
MSCELEPPLVALASPFSTKLLMAEFDLNFVLTTTSKIHRRATTAHRTSLLPSTVVLSDFCSVAALSMDPEAARNAREALDLAFHMSNILDTGLDRHTLSILMALCDLGVNPEALAAIVKELRKEKLPRSPLHPTPPS